MPPIANKRGTPAFALLWAVVLSLSFTNGWNYWLQTGRDE
jgi:hypothetical protein